MAVRLLFILLAGCLLLPALPGAADLPPIAVRAGLSAEPAAVEYSVDGKSIAACDQRGRTVLIDTATGAPRLVLAESSSRCPRFSPDGRLIALIVGASTIKLFDVATGDVVSTIEAIGPDRTDFDVFWIAFSPDSSELAVCGYQLPISVYSVAGGQLKARAASSTAGANRVEFDGPNTIVFSKVSQPLSIIDAGSGQPLTAPAGMAGLTTIEAVSADDSLLVLSGASAGSHMMHAPTTSLSVWNTATGASYTIDTSEGVRNVAVATNGSVVAGVVARSNIVIWDAKTGSVKTTVTPATRPGLIGVARGGAAVVASSPDNTLSAYGPAGGAAQWVTDSEPLPVTCLAFSPDGASLYTGHGSGELIDWTMATLTPRRQFVYPDFYVGDMALSRSGKMLAISDAQYLKSRGRGGYSQLPTSEDDIQIIDTGTWKPIQTLNVSAPFSPLNSLAFSPDETLLVAANHRGLSVYSTANWTSEFTSSDRTTYGTVRFAPSGEWFMDGQDSYKLFELPKFTALNVSNGNYMTSFAITPDSKFLIDGNDQGAVSMWPMAPALTTGQMITNNGKFSKVRAGGAIGAIEVTGDGQTIVAGADDGVLRFLNASDLTEIAEAPTNGSPIESIAIRADDKLIATGSADGTIRLWRTDTHSIIATAVVEPSAKAADGTSQLRWFAYNPAGVIEGVPSALATAMAIRDGVAITPSNAGYHPATIAVGAH